MSPILDGGTIELLDQEARDAASQRLNKVLSSTKIARNHRYLTRGRPSTAIAEAAHRSRASMVVMGAVSRSGIKRLVIGNTAERILDDLSCDILVIKHEGFRSRVAKVVRGARLRVATTTNMMGYY